MMSGNHDSDAIDRPDGRAGGEGVAGPSIGSQRGTSTTDRGIGRPPREGVRSGPSPTNSSADETPLRAATPAVPLPPTVWYSPSRHATPIISLVVPALNEEKLIGSILSLFGEGLARRESEGREGPPVEIIVSDGGSSDRTVAIAREYADVVAEHREPRRQTIAEGRNLGAAQAEGDLLVFINADTRPQNVDEFLDGVASMCYARSDEKGPVAWACPVRIAPDEQRLSDRLFHGFFNRYVRLLNLIGLGMGRGECQVVWRDDFEAVGGYENHMAAGEDFDLYRRLSDRGAIGHAEALRVYESPRRFRRFGYLRVLFEWTLNGLAVMILGRSISKEWEQIR